MEASVTAIDWIRRLKFPYYTQATEILKPSKINQRYDTMLDALMDALDVDRSQEGRQYWVDVANGNLPIRRPAPYLVVDDSGESKKIHATGITEAIEEYRLLTGRSARQAILI